MTLERQRTAGLDEAGRGSVLGPLAVAGVVLDEAALEDLVALGVDDSKRIRPRRREELAIAIRERAIAFEVILSSPAEIDRSPGNQEAPDHVVVRKQQRELVRKGIEALPTRYRKVVWLRYVKDSSYEEIMQSVQVPMGTVKTWLSRGRHQLKGELRRMGL